MVKLSTFHWCLVACLGLVIAVQAAPSLVNKKNARDLVTNLPDYPGKIHHYAGYVNVNAKEGKKLFYYFVPARRNPHSAPVIIWVQNSVVCSSMTGFMYEHGPFKFQLVNAARGKMKVTPNRYSWHNLANVVYLDVPTGIGFSMYKIAQGSADGAAAEIVEFLKGFFSKHVLLTRNSLYLAAETAGVPTMLMMAQRIKATLPWARLQGYVSVTGRTNQCRYSEGLQLNWLRERKLITPQKAASYRSKCNGRICLSDTTICPEMAFLSLELAFLSSDAARVPVTCPGVAIPGRKRRLRALLNKQSLPEDTPEDWSEEIEGDLDSLEAVGGARKTLGEESVMGDALAWEEEVEGAEDGSDLGRQLKAIRGPKGGPITCQNFRLASIYYNRNDVRRALHVPAYKPSDPRTRWLACRGENGRFFRRDFSTTFPRHKALAAAGLRILFLHGIQHFRDPYQGARQLVKNLGLTPTFKAVQVKVRSAGRQVAVASPYGRNEQVTLVLVPNSGAFVMEDNPAVAYISLQRFLARKSIQG